MKFDIIMYDKDQIALNVCVEEYYNPFMYWVNLILMNLMILIKMVSFRIINHWTQMSNPSKG